MYGFRILVLVNTLCFQLLWIRNAGNGAVVKLTGLEDIFSDQYEDEKCMDAEPSACPTRFHFETCQKNYKMMLEKCRKTCHLCEVEKPPKPTDTCTDAVPSVCPQRFDFNYCRNNYYEMLIKCRKTCHLCEVAKPPSPAIICQDDAPLDCQKRFDFAFCQSHYYEMLYKCRKTCHLCEVEI